MHCADVIMVFFFRNLGSVLIAGSILDDPIFSRRKQGSQPKTSEELEDAPVEGIAYPSDSSSSSSKEIVKLGNGGHASSST